MSIAYPLIFVAGALVALAAMAVSTLLKSVEQDDNDDDEGSYR
jgi:hypothetical protein